MIIMSTRPCHCGNPTLQSEMAPKRVGVGRRNAWCSGQFYPFLFYKAASLTQDKYFKSFPGLKVATDAVTNATTVSSLATGLVVILMTTFLITYHPCSSLSLRRWWATKEGYSTSQPLLWGIGGQRTLINMKCSKTFVWNHMLHVPKSK